MERTRQALGLKQIIEINRRVISDSGGSFYEGDDNLINRGSLEYLLESLTGEMFGRKIYPSVIQQAAALGWNIIVKHVFHDGNKRTGMLACQLFLDFNNHDLPISTGEKYDKEAVEIAERIAKGEIDLPQFTEWIESRVAVQIPAQ